MKRVRTRFAPSPTGMLHLGGIRTALYNYLLAKKYGGDFILRIEDTDRARFVKGAQEYIVESLKWLGIEPNEGVVNGGKFGPYLQSLRKDLYKKYAETLVKNGFAYYAFDTEEELEEMHKRLANENCSTPKYNSITRKLMKNSLTLSEEEVNERIKNGCEYIIRFKTPEGKDSIRFHDVIRGWIKVSYSTLDDKVLLKSDGMATYHLASVVDDHLMEISHIIRGEEWLPSMPLHVLMYKAFGWEETMPQFVHLPLLLKQTGQGKLSKRDADDEGLTIFPLSWTDEKSGKIIEGFREKGFLPEAIINALALMGWNPGDNNEIFTINELIDKFSLEKLQKGGARFNIKKIEWFNHQYIKNTPNSKLKMYVTNNLQDNIDDKKINSILDIAKERAYSTKDIWAISKTFLFSPKTYEYKNLVKEKIDFAIKWIEAFMDEIIKKGWGYEEIHAIINEKLEKDKLKMSDIMPTFRLALFGTTNGPDVVKSIIILGREGTLKRIKNLKEYTEKQNN